MRRTPDASRTARAVAVWNKHLRPFAKRVVHKSERKTIKNRLMSEVIISEGDGDEKSNNCYSKRGRERSYDAA